MLRHNHWTISVSCSHALLWRNTQFACPIHLSVKHYKDNVPTEKGYANQKPTVRPTRLEHKQW
eukprot:6309109-Amphidinium_carterae.2